MQKSVAMILLLVIGTIVLIAKVSPSSLDASIDGYQVISSGQGPSLGRDSMQQKPNKLDTIDIYVSGDRLYQDFQSSDGYFYRDIYTLHLRPISQEINLNNNITSTWTYQYDGDPDDWNSKIIQEDHSTSGVRDNLDFDSLNRPTLAKVSYDGGIERYFSYKYFKAPKWSGMDVVKAVYFGDTQQEAEDNADANGEPDVHLWSKKYFLTPDGIAPPTIPTDFWKSTEIYSDPLNDNIVKTITEWYYDVKILDTYKYGSSDFLIKYESKLDFDVSAQNGWDDHVIATFTYHPNGLLDTVKILYVMSGVTREYKINYDVLEPWGVILGVDLISENGVPFNPPIPMIVDLARFSAEDDLMI